MAAKRTKKSKKPDSETTHEKRFRFLCLLSETGNVSESARKAGINRQYVYDLRDSDSEFAAAWEKCLERAGEVLLNEARRRAVDGVEEPVFYKGEICGTVLKYSDALLSLLLKATFPDKFQDRSKVEHDGKIDVTGLDERIEKARKNAGKA